MLLPFGLAIRRGIVYEGECSQFLRAIHPTPLLTDGESSIFTENAHGVVFREDSFDPVTRIRRGRFYHDRGNPSNTLSASRVCNYPYGNLLGISCDVFDTSEWYLAISQQNITVQRRGEQIILGQGEFKTIWRVIDVEKISSGDLFWTLKSISTMGALPILKKDLPDKSGNNITPAQVLRVHSAIDNFVDALNVQQPTPIVDVARETARIFLATWIGHDAHAKDLGDVVRKIQSANNEDTGVILAGKLLGRFHSRTKTSEQERRQTRPVVDDDAGLSIRLIGFLLREIGWAEE
jgi:hypothetical protein